MRYNLEPNRTTAFDIETTGLSVYKGAEIFAYCVAEENGHVEVYRIDDEVDVKEAARNLNYLRDYFAEETIAKVCHNYKFEYTFIKKFGLYLPERTVWHDTMLQSQLLRNLSHAHSLDYLAYELAGCETDTDKEVMRQQKQRGGFKYVDLDLMERYQKNDGYRTILLHRLMYPKIQADKKLHQDYWVEIELVRVTQHMESFGIKIDREEASTLLEWIDSNFQQVQQKVKDEIGEYCNLNSDKKVREILYNQLELPVLAKTDSGMPAVDKDVIFKFKEMNFKYPILDLILQWRSYVKGAAMINNYLKAADHEDIIRPTIKTNEAATGREACENPNLQNIAKEFGLKNPYPIPARRCFRAREKSLLLLADYAGIEMRLIIEVAKDEELIKMIKEGKDVHLEALYCFYAFKTKEWLDNLKQTDPAQFKLLRNACKNGHFALGYGAGIPSVANAVNLTIEELKPGYDLYKTKHPKIVGLLSTIADFVQEHGYIDSVFGRKLWVPTDKAYMGLNYKIQHTAACILKRAQIRVSKFLKEEFNDEIRLLLPVHDELIFHFPRKFLKDQKEICLKLSKLMTYMPEIEVPLDVEWKQTTTTWDRAKEIK